LPRLAERSQADNIGDIHGSHDYRMENILGKCRILGLSNEISAFAEKMEFILRFLNQHIQAISLLRVVFRQHEASNKLALVHIKRYSVEAWIAACVTVDF
jgi:hypothetical protein